MANTATTYDPVDADYVQQLRERKNLAEQKQNQKEYARQNVDNDNMDDVRGLNRIKKSFAKNLVKKDAVSVVKKKLGNKILSAIPFVSTVYGAYVLSKTVVSSDKENVPKFGLLAWFLFLFSNIELILITLVAIALIYLFIDIMENPIDALWTYGIGPIAEAIKLLLS